MTDKQQIEDIAKIVSTDCIIKDKEQMARIIAFDLCKQSYHSNWYGNEAQCYSDNNFHDCKKIKVVVDKLYNANYRKVPENAVVLTEEEYNALMLEQKRLKEIVDRIPCGYELKDKTRKETAKEIFTKLIEVAKNNDNKLSIGLLKAWAIEYDVEVEE